MSHLRAEVFIAGAWFSIPCSPCHDDHKTRWCGDVTRWKPAGILNECEEVPWACSRLLWARNKTVLFIPQHNLSYSEFYSRWCGHCTHSFRSHFMDENISAWIGLVQGLAGLCMLHRYGNNRSRCVGGAVGPTSSPHIPVLRLLGMPSSHFSVCAQPTHPPKHSLLQTPQHSDISLL